MRTLIEGQDDITDPGQVVIDEVMGMLITLFLNPVGWTGAIAGGIGSALLILDLGRKSRFLLMLRVFRPTSPMSVGSWVLALATPM